MQGNRAERGQILPMVALLLVVILGIAALAIDGSNSYSQHRKFQADLDVAIKVAASDMFDADPASAAYTSTAKTAIAEAAQALAADGYANALTSSTSTYITASGGGFCGSDPNAGITICNPPRSGLFAGAPHYDYVEGYLSRDVGGFFGGVLGLVRAHISVRAVGWHGGYHQPYAVIGLDPNGSSITVPDLGATMAVTGSIIADGNSFNNGTAIVSGRSDQVQTGTTNQITGTAGTNQGVPSIVDPYGAHTVGATEPITYVSGNSGGVFTAACAAVANQYLGITSPNANAYYFFAPDDGSPAAVPLSGTISQDSYYFLPSCAHDAPGIFRFSGTLHMSGQASIASFNSVFVFDDTAGLVINDTGLDAWQLNAPASGPYQGIALAESGTSAEPPCPNGNSNVTLAGNASVVIRGIVNMPCAVITTSGNSNAAVTGVLVGYDVITAGNGTLTVTYDPSGTPPDKGSVLVE